MTEQCLPLRDKAAAGTDVSEAAEGVAAAAERLHEPPSAITPLGIATIDGNGTIMTANAELERMTGHAPGSLAGQTLGLVLDGGLVGLGEGVSDGLPQSVRAGHVEMTALRSDGARFPVGVAFSRLEIKGEPVTIVKLRDISERHQIVSAFRDNFEGAPYGLLLCDRQGRITRTNSPLDAMFGYAPGDLVGQLVEVLLPPRFRSGHLGMRDAYLAHPTRRMMGEGRDLTGWRKAGMGGTEFPLEIGLSTVVTPEGPMVCAWVVDITWRKRGELRLREANAQLEEFTHVISHDLRSPIRGISNLIDFIVEDHAEVLPAAAMRNLTRMTDRIASVERLIDDLLAYARAGRRGGLLETIDLNVMLDEILQLEDAGPQVHFSLDLPDETFEGARTVLATVIRNLVSNAIRHHDRDEKHIAINACLEGNYCIIEVIDDGPGIPESAQKRAFRLFQTLSSGASRGSGLGLAIVQRLVEGNGGSIALHSTDGRRGCRFCVKWPRFMRSDLDD
ncbi:MAG TPA: PAS domain-containing sensor histidine kinase [Novosphingobium sp.]|nr:PAS domain-containing sensor histidine kinase [Novosphingobium sp.]